jgi:hypothetical protein
MTVTVASFRTAHPEFATVPADAVVQAAIDKAGRLLDATVIPSTVYDDAVEWQAYLYIGTGPYARDKRVPVIGDDHLATARRNLDDILMASGRAYRILP